MRCQIQTCSYCGSTIVGGEFCKLCINNYKDLPSPGVMSGEGRQKEFQDLVSSPVFVPISMVYERFNQLVGREIKYGELTTNWEGLLKEAYNNN